MYPPSKCSVLQKYVREIQPSFADYSLPSNKLLLLLLLLLLSLLIYLTLAAVKILK